MDSRPLSERWSPALQNAMDARRRRIVISQSSVNWVKWTALLLQAGCTLVAIAMVHSDNRLGAASPWQSSRRAWLSALVLIASHNQPFTGEISVGPDVLIQVMPGRGHVGSQPLETLAEPGSAPVKGNNKSEERSIVGGVSGLTCRVQPLALFASRLRPARTVANLMQDYLTFHADFDASRDSVHL